jgi:hypothetical protein
MSWFTIRRDMLPLAIHREQWCRPEGLHPSRNACTCCTMIRGVEARYLIHPDIEPRIARIPRMNSIPIRDIHAIRGLGLFCERPNSLHDLASRVEYQALCQLKANRPSQLFRMPRAASARGAGIRSSPWRAANVPSVVGRLIQPIGVRSRESRRAGGLGAGGSA